MVHGGYIMGSNFSSDRARDLDQCSLHGPRLGAYNDDLNSLFSLWKLSNKDSRLATQFKDEITEKDIQLVRAAWAWAEKDYHGLGMILFTELFKVYPDFKNYFNKMKSNPDQDIFESPRFKRHMVTALFPAMAEMLANLDLLEKLDVQLRQIAVNHKRRNLSRHHFEAIQKIILVALKKYLRYELSSETEAAFNKVLTVTFEQISTYIENS